MQGVTRGVELAECRQVLPLQLLLLLGLRVTVLLHLLLMRAG